MTLHEYLMYITCYLATAPCSIAMSSGMDIVKYFSLVWFHAVSLYFDVYKFVFSIYVGKTCGKVHVLGEELEDNKFDLVMQFSANNLDKKDFFGKVGGYNASLFTLYAVLHGHT